MGYPIEELLENLPDYINNKIEDNKLKDAISAEISVNPDFRKEYDLISITLRSVNSIEFTEPPANYFNSLLPRINERMTSKSGKFKFTKSFSTLWKYAVPIAAIIIFFIGYKTIFRNNDYINDLVRDSQIVLTEFNYSDEKKVESLVNPEENKTDLNVENKTEENTDVTYESKKTVNTKIQVSEKDLSKKEEIINAFLELSDNSPEEDVFFSNDDDMNIEQDFEKMNKEEQNNLISKIKNSNL